MSVSGKRIAELGVSTLLLTGLVLSLLPLRNATAAQITTRSLTLQQGAGGDGGSKPGGTVRHLFTFTLPSTSAIGSIRFQYCTTASGNVGNELGDCTKPTGLNTDSATLTQQTGATGFTFNAGTLGAGAPYLTRPSAAPASQTVSYQLSGVVNPTGVNQTFFVRIATYASTDTTGAPTDVGSVAASTANQIVLTGIMPESLIFCTGDTVPVVNDVPNCGGSIGDGAVVFNQLFSSESTAYTTSAMAASTNAGSGYNITVNGPTLTSSSNTITAMNTADTSKVGVSQFGLNLKANATPLVGTEITPASSLPEERLGKPAAGYDTADTFKFASGDSVAKSDFDTSPKPSNGQVYTASYIVNVKGSQPPGVYTTTLTYICTPTF